MEVKKLLESMDSVAAPMQPFLKRWTAGYVEHKMAWNPMCIKKDGLFYQFRVSEACEIPILPDACVNILIECEGEAPQTFLCGIRPGKAVLKIKPDCLYFGFKPYTSLGIRAERVRASELVNGSCTLEDAFPEAGGLVEKMVAAESFRERVGHMVRFALDEMVDYEYKPDFVDYLAVMICVAQGNLEYSKLDALTGYSTRYVRQRFKDVYGISPKQYGQIMRFQGALKLLLTENAPDLSHLAQESGYYDQAHFIHAFKDHSTYTPMECLQMSRRYR